MTKQRSFTFTFAAEKFAAFFAAYFYGYYYYRARQSAVCLRSITA